MLSPRQFLLQWAEATGKRQARRVSSDGHAMNAAACELMVQVMEGFLAASMYFSAEVLLALPLFPMKGVTVAIVCSTM